VEIQGTAEKTPFTGEQLQQLQSLGSQGIRQLVQQQKAILETRMEQNRMFPLLKLL
jgi:ribonuclease PH